MATRVSKNTVGDDILKKNHLILSLDCGSTNFKAALFDGGLHRLAEAKLPVQSLSHGIDRVELDPGEVWRTTVELLELTCQRIGLSFDQVTRLAITSQAQTFLLLDENGEPLTPLISWLDRRAVELLPQVQQALGKDFSQHCSFSSPLAQMQVGKLLWIKQFAPDLLARTRLIAPLPTWLGLRLGSVAAIDSDIAAMSGLYSLQSGGYWQPALELCGIQGNQLPALVKAGTALPSSRQDLILAGNDQTCGAIGNDCQRDVWVVALGTALVAFRLAGRNPGPFHATGCWGMYPLGGYYEYAVQNYGCAALDWAHQALFPGGDMGDFFTSAQKAMPSTPTTRLFFYPDQIGTPSAWIGDGSPAEMALSVLDGIGYALRSLIFDELGATGGLHKLIVTGGGSRSDFWLQLLADILGIGIQRGDGDSLLGAARLASPETVPPQGASSPIWLPDPARAAAYNDNYGYWRQRRMKQ